MIAAKLAVRPPNANTNVILKDQDRIDINTVPPTIQEAADLLAVSRSSVQTAKIVTARGSSDLQAMVSNGQVPVTTGARVADLPPDEQRDYVDKVRSGVDPVKAAPSKPEPKDRRPPAPPKFGGNPAEWFSTFTNW